MIKFVWPDGTVCPLYIAVPLIIASWAIGMMIGYAIAGVIIKWRGW